MRILERNNVVCRGAGEETLLFSHGFGCDQQMWRFVAPAFEEEYRTVLFDHVGAGKSLLSHYDRDKYSTLYGYARDVLEICDALGPDRVTFVGHSVSAVIGLLAAVEQPARFQRLVLVAPSPCYINDPEAGYTGGFTRDDILDLLEVLDSNYLGWSSTMAPVIMGNASRPELGEELTSSFCRTDPEIAKHFARVTFLSDHRDVLPRILIPSLILQCSEDAIAPVSVGEYMHRALDGSRLVLMRATGHCPNMSAPAETVAAMRAFLDQR